tara:strand:+ start:3232 stop:3768 length:537 start_codon:yes stop_codon:yes gene_type:complete
MAKTPRHAKQTEFEVAQTDIVSLEGSRAIGTEWEDFTLVTNSGAFIDAQKMQRRRNGDQLEISGWVTFNGSVPGGIATFDIPNSLILDMTKKGLNTSTIPSVNLGDATRSSSAQSLGAYASRYLVSHTHNIADNDKFFITHSGDNKKWLISTWGSLVNSGDIMTLNLSLPIVGWTATD